MEIKKVDINRGSKSIKDNIKRISYSQYTLLKNCPLHWKLNYVDNLRKFNPNIYNVLGTSIHETCQKFLDVAYNDSLKHAHYIDMKKEFIETFYKEYENANKQINTPLVKSFAEIETIIEESDEMLKDFVKKWKKYFKIRGYKLLGIEKVIDTPIFNTKFGDKLTSNALNFYGFIDVVIKNTKTNKITIIDLKTSYRGWNKQKVEQSKLQLLLYKNYFYQQYKEEYNIESLSNIELMFIVMKRKVFVPKESEFTPSRVKKIIVPSKQKFNKYISEFKENILSVYDVYENDIKLKDIEFKPNANDISCKYCEHKNTDLCNAKKTRKARISSTSKRKITKSKLKLSDSAKKTIANIENPTKVNNSNNTKLSKSEISKLIKSSNKNTDEDTYNLGLPPDMFSNIRNIIKNNKNKK